MKARGWPYVVTGVAFAAICAWISYNDGLFVTRLAGNSEGRIVYFYPLVPDVLIVISLLALREAAGAGVDRSGWAVAGLRLGIVLTLAMNIYAGIEHSVLAAIQDGVVPVVFFIAVEIVLWHVRHGRAAPAPETADPVVARSVPPTVFEAAKASMAATADAGNPLSRNQLQARFGLSRAEADEIWQPYKPTAGTVPAGRKENGNGEGRQDGDPDRQRQGRQAGQGARRGQQPEEQVAVKSPPAGEPAAAAPAPAGAGLQPVPQGPNGSGPHG